MKGRRNDKTVVFGEYHPLKIVSPKPPFHLQERRHFPMEHRYCKNLSSFQEEEKQQLNMTIRELSIFLNVFITRR